MAKKKKIIIGILLVIVIIFFILAILTAFFGKGLVETQIEQNLKMKSRVGSVSLGLPFNITIKKIEIEDLFKAKRISFSPDLLGLVAGKIVLHGVMIFEPVINLEQSAEGGLNLPPFKQGGKPPVVFLTGLLIEKGKLNFVDKKIQPEGLVVRLDDINVNVSKVMFPPTSLNTKFKLSADILSKDLNQLGSIEGSGWIDFGSKNMDAIFQLAGLEVAYFSPYYGSFISKRKLLSANLDLNSQLTAKSNDLEVLTNLKLSKLVYAQEESQQEGGLPGLDFTKNALDLFTDKQGNLSLDFALKTKLDHPEISQEKLKSMILNAAAKNLASQPPQDLIEKVSNVMQQFKDFGKQMKEMLKE